jgi:hypothetical protein
MRQSSGIEQGFTNVPKLARVYCETVNNTSNVTNAERKQIFLLRYYVIDVTEHALTCNYTKCDIL